MKEAIRQRALELGFDLCRFTSAQPPATGEQLNDWLATGQHGEMAWLQRNAHKRTDPQQVLPGARSFICLATSYHDESGNQSPAHGQGLMARYARYKDYHDVLSDPLKKLAEFMDVSGGAQTRSLWYVDTGPILERDFAQRAGIGFVGKHTNLISRQLGNWIFLSEIITTLELEPDTPETNRCGSCTRCLQACPTNALPAPFQLDARRCISYLTIELKGAIPLELRPLIGNHIYGCDDCLTACPWNRFAQAGSLLRPYRQAGMATPDLLELLALDNATFKARFAGTPVLRTKRRGLLRNICVALGNTAGKEALPALRVATQDSEALIAEHAAWAIAEIERRMLASGQ